VSARIGLAGAAFLAALALPEVAAAHAAGINYRSPLPVWLYALAGALAVVASAPAAALAFTKRGDWTSRNFYPGLRRFHLGAIGLTLTSLLFVVAIVGGLFGEQFFSRIR
jgi:hypothetical protein